MFTKCPRILSRIVAIFPLLVSIGAQNAWSKPVQTSASNESSVRRDQGSGQEQEQDKQKPPIKFSVADGRIEMSAPGDWKQVDPAVNMIEAEFSIPAVGDDTTTGRLTVMGAGGSVQANLDRWIGQVKQPDGSDSRAKATISEKDVQGLKVHLLDIGGTYQDQRGPQAPSVERKNYRLLAAIIETGSVGSYFVKFYGPEKTVAKHKDAFVKMIEEIKLTE
jgi:hypothetical protein